MIKNNWINRIFRSKRVEECQKKATKATELYARRDELLKELKSITTLGELLDFHKKIWSIGYRNANIGPCSYGIFRTSSIEDMKPEEVFLGGIWGLYTKNIPFWELYKDEDYGPNGFGIEPETSLYAMIADQYRSHLRSNLRAIANAAKKEIDEYLELGYEIFYQNAG